MHKSTLKPKIEKVLALPNSVKKPATFQQPVSISFINTGLGKPSSHFSPLGRLRGA
jgi:hypothetical protein